MLSLPRRPATLAALFLALALPALFAHAQAAGGNEVMENGVLHVKNGATPSGGVETLDLVEQWRIGGDDEDSVLLGIVTRVLLDKDDNIYLLDGQLSEVQVYSPQGELLRTLGRQGSGPGEVTNPGDVVFMPDGTLGLVQIFPGKIVTLNMDGTPAGDFNPDTGAATAGGFLALVNGRGSGGNLVLSGIQISMDQAARKQNRTYFVRSYDGSGKLKATYIEKPLVWDFTDNFKFREIDNDFIWWRMDVGPDGKLVACEPRYDYALSVFDAAGKLERVIDREYESWTRSPKVFERYSAIMEAQSAQFPPGTAKEVEKMEQDVSDLRVARDGTIWVLPSRQMFEPEKGFFATYDLFSPAGQFVKQVKVRCQGDPAVDRLIFAGQDLVFQVTGFWDAVMSANAAGAGGEGEGEAEPMEVICYRAQK
jgi:hypothetical protein